MIGPSFWRKPVWWLFDPACRDGLLSFQNPSKMETGAGCVCRLLGIAPAIALISIGIHSLSDFNLHIPANMIVLIAVISIGYRALCAQQDETLHNSQFCHYDRPGVISTFPHVITTFLCHFERMRNLVLRFRISHAFGGSNDNGGVISTSLSVISTFPRVISTPTLSFRGAKRREILFFSVISTFLMSFRTSSVISNIPHVISNVCEKSLRFLTPFGGSE